MNVLITGVSKGLGLKLVETFLESGYTVYGISRSKSDKLFELEKSYDKKFFWKSLDFSKELNIKKDLFKDFISNKTPLHGFINNAAIAYDDIITNLRHEPLQEMYHVNVLNPMLIVKYAIRNMLFHRLSGSILHISSISVHTGYKGLAMYASTKGALEAFSKNTAREWGEKGIRSNCIVSGFMETEMNSDLSKEMKQRIYARTALKQPVNQNDVAKTALFLLSNDAKSITGENIFVDSGTI